MKKKHHHKKKGHRNNGGGGGPPPRPRSSRVFRRGPRPDWKTVVAQVLGGAGGATVGGLLVSSNVLPPEAVELCLMGAGTATAYFGDGAIRVVGASVASALSGQLALTLITRYQASRARKAHQNEQKLALLQAQSHSGQPAAQLPAAAAGPPPAPPPPPPVDPRQSAHGGGLLVDLFQDVSTDLDMVEDEWRFGMRDEPRDAAEAFVIDLDEAA